MARFTATVIREIRVEVEMPEGFTLNEDNDDESYARVEQFMDAVYAAVPDGIVHHQSITAWDEHGTQVL